MKTYTKEQLVKGMAKYYEQYNENPDKFDSNITDCEQDAIETIDYLLNIVDNETK